MRGRCIRCGGCMVETFVEGEAECREDPAGIWKCVNCGEVIDSQILANRCMGTHTLRRLSNQRCASLPLDRVS